MELRDAESCSFSTEVEVLLITWVAAGCVRGEGWGDKYYRSWGNYKGEVWGGVVTLGAVHSAAMG